MSRKNHSLLCLLTGIEPTERVDFADRQIRISIAWVASYSPDNEIILPKNCGIKPPLLRG
ncbi:hypothetical protein [Okeania sp. KiyG1]|uniref:hypothetical protein n=1 Tax=Okeania sp. KiyG1 TaxID=2720165 RepID=UPI00192490B8|nr:hypothetical protein [Okeania sp. KiyG1]GGA21195.1 hypothetical protein CYANOKiyG1_36110 [Okeania sp. KiyG1]